MAIVGRKRKVPKAPAHLSKRAKAWWRQVAGDFELEPHHLLLLTAAAECLDRMDQAREAIAKDGPFFVDRNGSRRAHPGLAVERDSRIAFARLLRELQLDADVTSESRPPALASYRG